MNKKYTFFFFGLIIIFVVFLSRLKLPHSSQITNQQNGKIVVGAFDQSKFKTDEEWKKILTQEQYHILREGGTETSFTGALNHETRKGTYFSVGCDTPLFRSEKKYDSSTGWPSF